MLQLHQSNRTERLADSLAELLGSAQAANPFAAEVVMVQSAGMGRWLQLALAERLGVCANVEFPFPAAFVWRLLRVTLGTLPERSDFDPPVLLWRLLALLDDVPSDTTHAPLAHWLAESDASGRYELAARLAVTFDRYLVYRPDWVVAWEAGVDTPEDEHAGWQAALWRRLAAAAAGPHWVRVREQFATAVTDGRLHRRVADGLLPARVALFGVPSLSPGFLEVLGAFGEAAEVHVFFANPSREYWGGLRSSADRAWLAERDPAEAMFVEVGQPLLASLGRQGADLLDLLLERDPLDHDAFEEPPGSSWLATLQRDILDLQHRGSGPDRLAPLVVDAADGSIEVHACHSSLREVEVLRDRLRDRFAREPDLDPSGVVVMVPDIADYAAAIEAVFGAEPAERRIDFRIADRGLDGESPLAAALFALLDSVGGRHDAASVLGLLDSSALRRRFEFDESSVERIAEWIAAARVRWGVDAEARAALGLPAEQAHTWRQGLDRLLLGYALPGEPGQLFAGLLPVDDVEGAEARVLGRFVAFAEALFELPSRLAGKRPPVAWARLLAWVLDRFFLVDDDEEDHARVLRAAIDDWLRVTTLAGFTDDLPLAVVLAALRERTGDTGGVHRFLTGGVTFCTLTPMRGIPFELVCLLGMNDGAFPRMDRRSDFDLSARRFRRGDRSRRADDRYLFLELLLGARRGLYISHVGQDIRDNATLPPSVLVAELLECVDTSFALTPDAHRRQQDSGVTQPSARHLITLRHPLQSFSPRYFDGVDGRLWSYDQGVCAALAERGLHDIAALLPVPLPAPDPEWLDIDLDTLVRFFVNPARYLLERRLGVRLPLVEGEAEASEPFLIGGLERWQLRQTLLDAALAGDPAGGLALARAAGMLPHGRVGEVLGRREQASASDFALAVAPMLAVAALPEPVAVELNAHGVRLRAALADIRADGRFECRLGRLGGRQVVALWLRHLAMCAAAPAGPMARSRLRDESDMFEIPPLEADRARAVLGDLLGLYREGLCTPLPFLPKSGWRYFEALHKGHSDPLSRAAAEWRGNDFQPSPPESADPWCALAFRDRDPIDERFETVTLTVFGAMEFSRD